MTERERERWGRRRQDGFWQFIVFEGALHFGPLAFVLRLVIDEWRGGPRPDSVTLSALIWMFMGLLWGGVIWHSKESRFAKSPAAPVADPVD